MSAVTPEVLTHAGYFNSIATLVAQPDELFPEMEAPSTPISTTPEPARDGDDDDNDTSVEETPTTQVGVSRNLLRQLRRSFMITLWPGITHHPDYENSPDFLRYARARTRAWFNGTLQQSEFAATHITTLPGIRLPDVFYTVLSTGPARIMLLRHTSSRQRVTAADAANNGMLTEAEWQALWTESTGHFVSALCRLVRGMPRMQRHQALDLLGEMQQKRASLLDTEGVVDKDPAPFSTPLKDAHLATDMPHLVASCINAELHSTRRKDTMVSSPSGSGAARSVWSLVDGRDSTDALAPYTESPERLFWGAPPDEGVDLLLWRRYEVATFKEATGMTQKATMQSVEWPHDAPLSVPSHAYPIDLAGTAVAAQGRDAPDRLFVCSDGHLSVVNLTKETMQQAANNVAQHSSDSSSSSSKKAPKKKSKKGKKSNKKKKKNKAATKIRIQPVSLQAVLPSVVSQVVVDRSGQAAAVVAPEEGQVHLVVLTSTSSVVVRHHACLPIAGATCVAFDEGGAGFQEASVDADVAVDTSYLSAPHLWVGTAFGILYGYRLDPNTGVPTLSRVVWTKIPLALRQLVVINGRLVFHSPVGVGIYELPDMPCGPPHDTQPTMHVLPQTVCIDAVDDVILVLQADGGTVVTLSLHDPTRPPTGTNALGQLQERAGMKSSEVILQTAPRIHHALPYVCMDPRGERALVINPQTLAVLAYGPNRQRLAASRSITRPDALPPVPPLAYGTRAETRYIHDHLVTLNALGFRTLGSQPRTAPPRTNIAPTSNLETPEADRSHHADMASNDVESRGVHPYQRAYVRGVLEPEQAAWLCDALGEKTDEGHPLAWMAIWPDGSTRTSETDGTSTPDLQGGNWSARDMDATVAREAWTEHGGRTMGKSPHLSPASPDSSASTRLVHMEVTEWCDPSVSSRSSDGSDDDQDILFTCLIALLASTRCPLPARALARPTVMANERSAEATKVATMTVPALVDHLLAMGTIPVAVQTWEGRGWPTAPPVGPNQHPSSPTSVQSHKVAYIKLVIEAQRATWLADVMQEHHPEIVHPAPGVTLPYPLSVTLETTTDDGELLHPVRIQYENDSPYRAPMPAPEALKPTHSISYLTILSFAMRSDWHFHNHRLLTVLALRLSNCPIATGEPLTKIIASLREERPQWALEVINSGHKGGEQQ